MKLHVKDYKKGFVKAEVENLDDLWSLSYVIESGDVIKSKTYRKIKLGGEDDRNTKVVKKPMTIAINVERIEFSKYSNVLRILGTIAEGPEEIPLGSHHTINVEEGSTFKLQKKEFLSYQIEKLEESSKEMTSKILICVHDREEAIFALLKKYGFEILGNLKGNAKRKTDLKTESKDFFPEIKAALVEYDKRYEFSNIIIASPGFWREYIQKILSEDIRKKCVFATCSSTGVNGINEVMKRDEIETVLRNEKFSQEMKLISIFLEEISKEGKAEYGVKEVTNSVNSGAVSDLLITDSFIQERRQDDNFSEIEIIMKNVEKLNGKVHIISSEHEGGNELNGLGGIGAVLRYKVR